MYWYHNENKLVTKRTDLIEEIGDGDIFDTVFKDIFSDIFPKEVKTDSNIIKTDTGYIIEIAFAGFRKEDIHIVEQNGNLKISGTRSNSPKAYSITKTFSLDKCLEVTDAILTDGMLTVNILKREPDTTKPRTFEVK